MSKVKSEDNIVEYLERDLQGWALLAKYNHHEYTEDPVVRFFLKHGRYWNITDKTFEGKRKTAKACYKNATDLVIGTNIRSSTELIYVEGYACSDRSITAHAWVVDRQGNVIDPTWEKGTQYFGIAFRWSYVMDRLYKRKEYGMFSDMIYYDDPIFTLPKKSFYHPLFMNGKKKKRKKRAARKK